MRAVTAEALTLAVEALAPFLREAEHFADESWSEQDAISLECDDWVVSTQLTVGDFRALARAVERLAALSTIPVELGSALAESGVSKATPEGHDLLEKATYIAAGAHNGQIDKGGAPYIQHVLRVVRTVETIEEKTVAALHDVLEDCSEWTARRLLEEGFSQEVVEAVVALTRRDDESYDRFIRRVDQNPLARRVKLADLADNSDLSRLQRAPGPLDLMRVEKYARAIAYLSSQTEAAQLVHDEPNPPITGGDHER